MDNNPRKAIAGLWISFSIISIVGFSVWFLFSGGFSEPWQQLSSFVGKTEIIPQNLSCGVAVGFVLLDLWLCIGIVFLLALITRKKPKMFLERWKKLLDLPLLLLFYRLLGGVAAEEIVFRWFPLAVLFPLWGTNSILWVVIIVSSLTFGLPHVFNQEPKNRKIIFVLPQIMGGVILSYIFLAFGLGEAIAIHLLFDVILLTILWVAYRVYPQLLLEQ